MKGIHDRAKTFADTHFASRHRLSNRDRDRVASHSIGLVSPDQRFRGTDWGGQLFLRKTRPVKFTSEGEILLRLAEDILPKLARAENDLASLKEDVNGRLHMAIECHSCFQWLMPALREYQLAWPSVTLDFSSGFGFEPLPALLAGELDLVITSDIQPRSEVHYEPLFDFEMRLITATNHPLAEKEVIDPQDLADQTMLSYPVQKQRLDVVKHFLQPAGVEPAKWKQADNTLMLVQMVSAGLGGCSTAKLGDF